MANIVLTVNGIDSGTLDLSWTEGTSVGTYYIWKFVSGGFVNIGTVAHDSTTPRTFHDTGLNNGISYVYYVNAYNPLSGYNSESNHVTHQPNTAFILTFNSLTDNVAPPINSPQNGTSGVLLSDVLTITPHNYTAPVTYFWERVGGDAISILDINTADGYTSSSNPMQWRFRNAGKTLVHSTTAIWRCTVTDSASHTLYPIVTIHMFDDQGS